MLVKYLCADLKVGIRISLVGRQAGSPDRVGRCRGHTYVNDPVGGGHDISAVVSSDSDIVV